MMMNGATYGDADCIEGDPDATIIVMDMVAAANGNRVDYMPFHFSTPLPSSHCHDVHYTTNHTPSTPAYLIYLPFSAVEKADNPLLDVDDSDDDSAWFDAPEEEREPTSPTFV